MRRRGWVAALAGVVLAGVLNASGAVADPAAAPTAKPHKSCHSRVCLTVHADREGPNWRITTVDVRKPRKDKVRAHARWAYREPVGRWHWSKRVRVTNNYRVAVAQWRPDKLVERGTRVCGRLGHVSTCTNLR